MIKIMNTDSGYMVRVSSEQYFFCFFQSLTDLVAFIKFSGINEVLVDDVSVSLSDAIDISKHLDESFRFTYSGVVHRYWKEVTQCYVGI
jgi:hypothetical protein